MVVRTCSLLFKKSLQADGFLSARCFASLPVTNAFPFHVLTATELYEYGALSCFLSTLFTTASFDPDLVAFSLV